MLGPVNFAFLCACLMLLTICASLSVPYSHASVAPPWLSMLTTFSHQLGAMVLAHATFWVVCSCPWSNLAWVWPRAPPSPLSLSALRRSCRGPVVQPRHRSTDHPPGQHSWRRRIRIDSSASQIIPFLMMTHFCASFYVFSSLSCPFSSCLFSSCSFSYPC